MTYTVLKRKFNVPFPRDLITQMDPEEAEKMINKDLQMSLYNQVMHFLTSGARITISDFQRRQDENVIVVSAIVEITFDSKQDAMTHKLKFGDLDVDV